jgi:hypothetical protein
MGVIGKGCDCGNIREIYCRNFGEGWHPGLTFYGILLMLREDFYSFLFLEVTTTKFYFILFYFIRLELQE